MNINMSDLRYINLFRHNTTNNNAGIAGMLRNANVAYGKGVAEAKISKDNMDYSLSISDLAHNMLERLKEEQKQLESGQISENKSSITEINGIEPKILEATISYGSDMWRMYCAAYQRDDYNNPGLDFDKLASTYAEIRDELTSQYTGHELERYLKQLDKDYDEALDEIVDNEKRNIIFMGIVNGKEGAIHALEVAFGKNRNELGFLIDKMGTGNDNFFNQSFWDAVESYIRNSAHAAMARYK